MSLQDAIKTAAGITASFGVGIYIGYEAARADAIHETEGPSLLENMALLGAGVLPQAIISSSDMLEYLTRCSAGIMGSFIGGFAGKKIWHRRCDTRTLTEKHKKRLEEIKQEFKNTITDEEEFQKTEKKFIQFMHTLLLYNAKPKLMREITEQTIIEIGEYRNCYEMLEQVQASQEIAFISRAKKDCTLNGLIYIHDNNRWTRIETTIDMQAVRRDDDPVGQAHCQASITKEETTDYNIKDIAEELRTTDRVIVLSGGNPPLDAKKTTAMLGYANEAVMRALRIQDHPTT
ncbi:hypothetical protein KY309_01960 [Candidatus Woesearchaeota archaeon]|nr:hypothetical protein [Candidatus Woesearchaeota archaeon]MBW3016352.1 hypothetical protein [Candidatus Woesearchaeota archaeon]